MAIFVFVLYPFVCFEWISNVTDKIICSSYLGFSAMANNLRLLEDKNCVIDFVFCTILSHIVCRFISSDILNIIRHSHVEHRFVRVLSTIFHCD